MEGKTYNVTYQELRSSSADFAERKMHSSEGADMLTKKCGAFLSQDRFRRVFFNLAGFAKENSL